MNSTNEQVLLLLCVLYCVLCVSGGVLVGKHFRTAWLKAAADKAIVASESGCMLVECYSVPTLLSTGVSQSFGFLELSGVALRQLVVVLVACQSQSFAYHMDPGLRLSMASKQVVWLQSSPPSVV